MIVTFYFQCRVLSMGYRKRKMKMKTKKKNRENQNIPSIKTTNNRSRLSIQPCQISK